VNEGRKNLIEKRAVDWAEAEIAAQQLEIGIHSEAVVTFRCAGRSPWIEVAGTKIRMTREHVPRAGWKKDKIALHESHRFALLNVEMAGSTQDDAESRIARTLRPDGPSA
jgi:hypothetical protein